MIEFHSTKRKIFGGSYFTTIVFNRCLYRRSVLRFKVGKYSVSRQGLFTRKLSFDEKMNACKIRDLKLKMGNTLSQAVLNKVCVTDLPREFRHIRRLEQVLIPVRLIFKKVTTMRKSQSAKLKGAFSNVPVAQLTFTCSKSIIETLEKGVTYVQS